MADLETLTLQINTESSKATEAIDALAQRLNSLSISIAKLETGKLNDLASGLNNLNAAIYHMNATSNKWDYKRIIGNITSLSTIDTAKLNDLSTSLAYLGNSLTGFASAVAVSDNVRSLVNAVGRLGGKSVTTAIVNIPLLENALSHLITSFSTLPSINQSVIDFTNSLANLASQGQRIGSATNTINNSLDRFSSAATRASRKSFNLASAIGKVYAQFWILMRAVSGLKKSFMDTADYLEAYNYFDVVAGKIGADTFAKAGVGSADDYAEAFTSEMRRKLKQMSGLELDLEDRLIKTTNAKSLGLNITEITQYQASIASITNAMGQAQEVSTATAKAFSMLAADMGSLRNVDYEQVAANLQSALTGQARALYKYGIDLTAATLEQYAYANGVDKAVSEMTQAEKAQLRLLAILDQSKVAWGDLANTINSPANQMRQLKTNLEELGTVFGQLFIPILQRTLPWVNGLSIALKQLLIDIASLLGIELNLDEFGQGFSDTIDDDTEAIDELNKSMKETKKGIREFDELKVIGGDKSKAGTGLSDQIDLTQQILKATDEYERVWDEAYRRMESKAQAIADALKSVFDPIRNLVEDFHIGNFFQAGEDISDLAISIFDFVSNAIDSVDWTTIGNKIGEFIDGIKWGEVLKSVGGVIASALQGALNLWTGIFTVAPFETALLSGFAILKFTGFGDIIKTGLGNAISKQVKAAGLSKEFSAALGKLGAISVGISLALTIDNVKRIKEGEYSASSLESLLKTMVSTLFGGAGFKMLASAIGISGGGFTLAIGTAISLLVNLAVLASTMAHPYEDAQKVWEEYYSWVGENNLDRLEIITNIELKEGEIDAQFLQIDDLTDKVYDLSLNYDKLTDGEKGLLKYYSDELIKVMPELADQIDKVTGAYKGTREELDKLVESHKKEIAVSSYESNMSELLGGISSAEYDLKDLNFQRGVALRKIESFKDWFKELMGEDYSDELWDYAMDYFNPKDRNKLFEGMVGYSTADLKFKALETINTEMFDEMAAAFAQKDTIESQISETESSLNQLLNKYNYFAGELEGILGEEVPKIIEDSNKTASDKQNKSKLPKAVETTIDKVNTQINHGDTVSKANMNKMFNSINTAFYGLPSGKVPEDVQATMDAIKQAIEDNSPELISLMENLKIQMENAFLNAEVAGNGEVLWNPKGVVTKIDNAFNSIQSALETGAKPGTSTLKDYVNELFGGNIPETVDKSLNDLADTIEKGKGRDAILDSIENLKYDIVTEAQKLGMNVDLGIAGGVFNGVGYVEKSTSYLVENGLVEPYKKDTETNSPSKLFKRLAVNIPEGIALGIVENTGYVTNAISTLAKSMQATFAGFSYNIPNLDLGSRNKNQYYSNDSRYSNAATSLYDAMSRAYGQMGNGQTEVVFRVEGDPYGIFKVVREENDKYRNRTQRSAF